MSLFGTSGIRGVVNQDLTVGLCHEVAQALGTLLPLKAKVCLATDTRLSGGALKQAIFAGLQSSGIDTTDLGILPTPALALLTREWGFDTGIMVTASHNPPEFNGIKLFNGNSFGYSEDQEQEIERVYNDGRFRRGCREGTATKGQGMEGAYLRFLQESLPTEGFSRKKIVVDPGNGAASEIAGRIFVEMGLDVLPLNDTPDGMFPGRNPEPKEDTLHNTIQFLRENEADLAVCFDGDADRVVFCDREGFLGFNESVAFISRLLVEDSGKKSIATTVETGGLLDLAVEDLGVEVFRGRVGDVHVAYLAQKKNSAIGVEQVGVYIFPKIGYYPDSIFAALTLLSRVKEAREIRESLSKLSPLFFDKSRISCPNEFKGAVMAMVESRAPLFGAECVNSLDGVRLEFGDSWMLVRASGTEPVIRVLAESPAPSKTRELMEKGVRTVQSIVSELRR